MIQTKHTEAELNNVHNQTINGNTPHKGQSYLQHILTTLTWITLTSFCTKYKERTKTKTH